MIFANPGQCFALSSIYYPLPALIENLGNHKYPRNASPWNPCPPPPAAAGAGGDPAARGGWPARAGLSAPRRGRAVLPRGGGGCLPGRSSTGLFDDLELHSRSMIRCPCSMAVGDAAVPARGPPIARDAVKGDGGAVGGLLPHVRAQQLHGPRRRSSFSTTRWY